MEPKVSDWSLNEVLSQLLGGPCPPHTATTSSLWLPPSSHCDPVNRQAQASNLFFRTVPKQCFVNHLNLLNAFPVHFPCGRDTGINLVKGKRSADSLLSAAQLTISLSLGTSGEERKRTCLKALFKWYPKNSQCTKKVHI